MGNGERNHGVLPKENREMSTNDETTIVSTVVSVSKGSSYTSLQNFNLLFHILSINSRAAFRSTWEI